MIPERHKPAVRTAVKLLSRLLVVLGVAFFCYALWTQAPTLAAWRPSGGDIAIALTIAVVYGASLFLQAESWRMVLSALERRAWSRRIAYRAYAETQIAKYLPGNVLHFVGRHLWMTREGAEQKPLALSAVIEIGLMALGAALVITTSVALFPTATENPYLRALQPLAPYLLALLALGAAGLFALSRTDRFKRFSVGFEVGLGALGVTIGYFVLQGVLFYLLCNAAFAEVGPEIIGLVVAAWLAGYVVPGAPGGLGAREAVMLILFQGLMPEAMAVLAIATWRIVTTIGDMVCFGLGRAITAAAPHAPA